MKIIAPGGQDCQILLIFGGISREELEKIVSYSFFFFLIAGILRFLRLSGADINRQGAVDTGRFCSQDHTFTGTRKEVQLKKTRRD